MVGAGKSSLINTFLSALDPQGRTMTCDPTGDNIMSLTPQLRSYRKMNIKFWDTTGWNVLEYPDQTKGLLQMILEGRVPEGTNLQLFKPDSDDFKYPVIQKNVIHGVAFIFDIDNIDFISHEQIDKFDALQMTVAQKYVHRVVIGTKFELLGIPEKHNAWIYQYKPLQQKFDYLAKRTGMDKHTMFVVSNHWRGGQIEMIRCILALYILDNLVRNSHQLLTAMGTADPVQRHETIRFSSVRALQWY